ncbi:TrkH family potassium uptake protein [Paenibacillus sp. N1-5-1-14]|uniref:TrkH family potassium uptake protein n=1 Tax=Paenibacillus radicibacter TaxID=2972488 RepID=UPI0021593BDD|nr:TrkH family potassium uptake protein [Paenibacillus radicibacter]MCR8642714.1 TrkH family potassium uptake protein [Paenibacillus radicibacter]
MFKNKYLSQSPPRILAVGIALIIMLGTVLLKLPFATNSGVTINWVDAFFTATSATCVTGLVVMDTGTTFSIFGQVVIISLVQIGGLGFMTFSMFFALVLKRRISLRERLILQAAMNTDSLEGIVRLIRRVLIYSLVMEGVAAIIFTIRWSMDMPLHRAIYQSIFHAISLFNNGGFDLFGEFTSFQKFASDPLINIVSMILVLSGGLGFIVLSEILDYRKTRRLSLHSKVVISMTIILTLLGAIVIFIFEFTNIRTLGSMDFITKLYSSFFQSISARSSGTSTVGVEDLRQATQFFLILLMFIGASPGSAGGGIKTTTFAIMLGAIIAMLRGKEDVVLFRHRIAKDLILKALTIIFMALFMVVGVSMILSLTEDKQFIMVLFETTSAVATVGMSMGLTPELSDFAKIVLCMVMFIGRLGPLTLAYALGSRKKKELYRYPEGKIIIG